MQVANLNPQGLETMQQNTVLLAISSVAQAMQLSEYQISQA